MRPEFFFKAGHLRPKIFRGFEVISKYILIEPIKSVVNHLKHGYLESYFFPEGFDGQAFVDRYLLMPELVKIIFLVETSFGLIQKL